MGAHWNMMIPLSIGFEFQEGEVNSDELHLPEPFCKGFEMFSRKVELRESRILGPRNFVSLKYVLKEDWFEGVKPLVKYIWSLMKAQGCGYGEERSGFWEENLEKISFIRDEMWDLSDVLSEMKDNYFIRAEGVPQMVVYEGWPKGLLNRKWRSSLYGLVVWTSGSKMQEDFEAPMIFDRIRVKVVEGLRDKVFVAELVQVLGY